MGHDLESSAGKRSLVHDMGDPVAPGTLGPGKRTLTERLGETARGGLEAATQPFPHLDALRPYLGTEQHRLLARTPVAIGGQARTAADAMGTTMGGEVRGWAIDKKVAFPAFPSVSEAMHEGAHVLGAGEDVAQQAAELVTRGQRVDHLFQAKGDGHSEADASPQFIVLSGSEELELTSTWSAKGLAKATIQAVLTQNLKQPEKWPERSMLDDHLQNLVNRALALKVWLGQTKSLQGHDVEITELIESDGKNNQGIFIVQDLETQQPYVVKAVNTGAMGQFEALQKLNGQPIAQPAQDDHPSFAKFVEAGPSQIPGGTFKSENPGFGLMEKAPGKALSTIHDECISQPEKALLLCEIYEVVGRNIGSLNFSFANKKFVGYSSVRQFTGWTHNDANPSNIYFDQSTNRVTLIDNDGVGEHGTHAIGRDVSDIFLLTPPIARQAGIERTEKGPDHAPPPGEIQLRTEFEMFHAFIKGYLPKTVVCQGINEFLLPIFQEIRQKFMTSYLERCEPRPSEEALRARFPAFYLPFQ